MPILSVEKDAIYIRYAKITLFTGFGERDWCFSTRGCAKCVLNLSKYTYFVKFISLYIFSDDFSLMGLFLPNIKQNLSVVCLGILVRLDYLIYLYEKPILTYLGLTHHLL